MKKSLFILPLLAMAFASCSSDEPANNEGTDQGEANYLSVNLVTAPSASSKAVGDDENYEDGDASEFAVNKVRFYFFDENDNAALVKKQADGSYVNYYDWTPPTPSTGEKPNVEKVISATVVINTQDKDGLPKSIVAVLNPTSDVPASALSVTDLNNIVKNFNTTDGFVMSNAVYANGTNKVVTVSVEGHLYTAAEAAKADPVTIYVERVLAKVRMQTAFENNNLIPTGTDKQGNEYQFQGKKLYAKFLGWNVTATTDQSRLMKEINPSWPAGLFGLGDAEPWNYPAYFRSFWGVNPDGVQYIYGPFNTIGSTTAADALKDFTSVGKNYTYLQENATSNFATGANATNPSKVIIAAQLVDENGNAVEFAEWGFEKFTVEGLKARLLQAVTLYKKEIVDGKAHFTGIDVKDITFKTATAVGEAGKDVDGRYYVFAQLTDEAAKATWCSSNAEDAVTVDANAALKALGHAKIWTNGYTYYFLDIQHLGTSIGVVRNHLYNINIKSLVGLGTPVYNPDEVIYPERPGDEDTFIAAEIKILSWRLVNQDIDLDWK